MKDIASSSRKRGFTLVEVLVVIAVFIVLVAVLPPSFPRKRPAYGALCMNNQKQIALGYILWAGDHEGEFPTQVSIARNGSMEFISTGYASLQFRPLS